MSISTTAPQSQPRAGSRPPAPTAAIAILLATLVAISLAAIAPIAVVPSAAAKTAPPGPEFRFAIIGDRTGGATPGVWESIIDQIEGLHRRPRGAGPAVDRHRRDPVQALGTVLLLSGQSRHYHRRDGGSLEDAHASRALLLVRSRGRPLRHPGHRPLGDKRAVDARRRLRRLAAHRPREKPEGAAHCGRLPQAVLVWYHR